MPKKTHPMGDITLNKPKDLLPWGLYARKKGESCWELVGEFEDRRVMDGQALVLGFQGFETKPAYRRESKFAAADKDWSRDA